ncbi:hypothetical protein PR048_033275 [Dryococelus australis]|uniref:Uncharacterized protein n=1 Tax=Dryococelus australis TaxID=614101 RepID=A0ABQ9G409_9NEOP|nr:hypothetical protein PR048_033275 [Dryococelus australis]
MRPFRLASIGASRLALTRNDSPTRMAHLEEVGGARDEIAMEQRWSEKIGVNGNDPRKPQTPRAPLRFLYYERPGVEQGSPWWEASGLTAQPPRSLIEDEFMKSARRRRVDGATFRLAARRDADCSVPWRVWLPANQMSISSHTLSFKCETTTLELSRQERRFGRLCNTFVIGQHALGNPAPINEHFTNACPNHVQFSQKGRDFHIYVAANGEATPTRVYIVLSLPIGCRLDVKSLPYWANCTCSGHTVVERSFIGAELPGGVSNKDWSKDKLMSDNAIGRAGGTEIEDPWFHKPCSTAFNKHTARITWRRWERGNVYRLEGNGVMHSPCPRIPGSVWTVEMPSYEPKHTILRVDKHTEAKWWDGSLLAGLLAGKWATKALIGQRRSDLLFSKILCDSEYRLARKHLANPITAVCGATANEHKSEDPVCRGLRSLAYSLLPNESAKFSCVEYLAPGLYFLPIGIIFPTVERLDAPSGQHLLACTKMLISAARWLSAFTVKGDDWPSDLREVSNTDPPRDFTSVCSPILCFRYGAAESSYATGWPVCRETGSLDSHNSQGVRKDKIHPDTNSYHRVSRRRFPIGCCLEVESLPFLSELHVIGARGRGASIYWRRVTRGVSNKYWSNDERIAKENGRRRLGQRSPRGVKHRVDQCLETCKFRVFNRRQAKLHNPVCAVAGVVSPFSALSD